MKSYVALVIVLFLGVTQALKCFQCNDCDEELGEPQMCAEDHDVCVKMEIGEHIMRNCSMKVVCGLGKLGRALNVASTDIVNIFKDAAEKVKKVYCCDDDNCNAGMKSLPSFSVILLPLVLVAIFKY